MPSLVFSLDSEDLARLADRELRRNGVKTQQIRITDLARGTDAENDPSIHEELGREAAAGRVLLEVHVDEQNQAAVERLIGMLDADARRLVTDR